MSVVRCGQCLSLTSYADKAQAEWVLSETMTGILENFNLLRMFRVARIIRPFAEQCQAGNCQGSPTLHSTYIYLLSKSAKKFVISFSRHGELAL